jgi:parvulin-like peptidyl-prolyl isomerase
MSTWNKLLGEPLLHFAVAGAALFSGYAWLNQGATDAGSRQPVVVGEGELRWLKETWSNQWLREPTSEELRGLVAELVNEELLAREAAELGLGENDTVVRRRLAQKLTFLVEDTARLIDPSDEELRRYHAANAAEFQSEGRISFIHIFFDPARRKDARSDAAGALAALRAGGDGGEPQAPMGDRLLLDAEFRDVGRQAVSNMLGSAFAQAVFRLKPGEWSGPIGSGYGVHLVFVSQVAPAAEQPFELVRGDVLDAWRREKQSAAQREFLERLRDKHRVEIDPGVQAMLGADPLELARR